MHFDTFQNFLDYLSRIPLDKRAKIATDYLNGTNLPVIENENVHFVFFGKAAEVKVNGDLQNGWSKADKLTSIDCGIDSLFYRSYKVPKDARLDYKFEVDGKYINDPRNDSLVPSGYGFNSELAMPEFKKTDINETKETTRKGVIEKLHLSFNEKHILPKELKIYLPHGYENLSDLPCIYVFDGEDMLNFAGYKNILDNCIYLKKIQPVVAVFIPSKERSDEYLNEKKKHLMNVLDHEIMPEIQNNFKVTKDPAHRALHGISASGYYSLCSIFKRPELFQNVAAHSSAIKSKLFKILFETMNNGGIPESSKIYFDVGRYDLEVYTYNIPWLFTDVNRKFSLELKKYGITHRFHEVNDGHSWANWRERIEEILVYFYGK